MTIGLISDTHSLLRPEALPAFQGCELILHAGDVGSPEILDALSSVAPVRAVRGNVDTGAWANSLPLAETVEIGGVRIFVIHILTDMKMDAASAGIGVVVSGHSHKAAVETRNNVLYCNPGSAGPRRFRLPVTVGRLQVGGAHAEAEIVTIL